MSEHSSGGLRAIVAVYIGAVQSLKLPQLARIHA